MRYFAILPKVLNTTPTGVTTLLTNIKTKVNVIERMINLDILDEDDYEKMSKQKRGQNQGQGNHNIKMSKSNL